MPDLVEFILARLTEKAYAYRHLVTLATNAGYPDPYRPVDRALQKLRKAGLIEPSNGVWLLAVKG